MVRRAGATRAVVDGDDERPEIGVDDGIELPVAEAPASALPESPEAVAPQGDVTEETVPAGSDAEDQTEAQQDTAEIVGNIIWNIESAQKGRVETPDDPLAARPFRRSRAPICPPIQQRSSSG